MRDPLNSVTINGDVTLYATGSCDIEMTVFGIANNTVLAYGDCAIDVGASGTGKIGVSGFGQAVIGITCTGTGTIGIQGSGSTTMTITATHGIPTPKLIPAQFNAAHSDYRLLVDARPDPVNE